MATLDTANADMVVDEHTVENAGVPAGDTPADVAADFVAADAATPMPAPAKRRRMHEGDAHPEGLDKALPMPKKRIEFSDNRTRRDYDESRVVGSKRTRFRSPVRGDRRRRSSGNGSGSFGRRNSRHVSPQTQEEMAQEQLRRMLSRVGDQLGNECEDTVFSTADIVEVDIRVHNGFIVKTLVDCAVNLPLKTSFYACLVGLVNHKEPKFGEDVLALVESRLAETANAGQTVDFTLLMLFVAELTVWRVIGVSDFWDRISSLMKLALDPETPVGKADFAAYLVISCVTRCGKYFYRSAGVENAIESLNEFFSKRLKSDAPHFQCVSGRLGESRSHMLELYTAFQDVCKDEFTVRVIRAPRRSIRDRVERARRHPFQFELTMEHAVGRGFRPLASLVLFPKTGLPERLSRMDAILLRDQFFQMAYTFHEDPKEAIKYLAGVAGIFQAEHILVEIFFSRLLDVSAYSRHPALWSALLVSFLKKDPAKFAPLLGRAANLVFRNLEHMDIESRDRFTQWFGFHLSNFGFQWPWSAWSFVSSLADDHPQKLFLKEAMSIAVRLSFWDRVQAAVKEDPQIESLLPPMSEPQIMFSDHSDCSPSLKQSYSTLREAIRRRDDISELLLEVQEDRRLESLTQAILEVGSKTYSHVFRLLDHYEAVLKNFATGSDSGGKIVNAVAFFWKYSDQHVMIIVDRLFRLGIVDASSIIEFVFDDDRVSDMHRSLHWKMLSSVALLTVDNTENAKAAVQAGDNAEVSATLEAALREQKDVFLMIMQRFVMLSTSALLDEDSARSDLLIKAASARLLQFSRKFLPQIMEYGSTLRRLVFTPETEQALLDVFTLVMSVGEASS